MTHGIAATPGELRRKLLEGRFILAPGVFDMFSTRIADRLPFEALYMTGYGISGSYLGLADAGLVSYTDMVSRARCIAEGSSKPLIADADTGFGGLHTSSLVASDGMPYVEQAAKASVCVGDQGF